MHTRSRPVVALTLVLAVALCASQSAFCDLACALGARAVLCHGVPAQTAMPAMAQSHCGDPSHARESEQTQTAITPAVSALPHGRCDHSAEPAIETEVSGKLPHTSAAITTIALLPSARVLQCGHRIPQASPALRPPPIDPLLVKMRV